MLLSYTQALGNASRQIRRLALEWGPDALFKIDPYVAELRAAHPQIICEVLPRVGFSLKMPYEVLRGVPYALAHEAHRIEGWSGEPSRVGLLYIHKDRDGLEGWCSPAQIQHNFQVARKREAEAAAVTGYAPSELTDLTRRVRQKIPCPPLPPTHWELLGQDDFDD